MFLIKESIAETKKSTPFDVDFMKKDFILLADF